MKSLFLFSIVTLLVSTRIYSQKVTYKQVIGTWHKTDTALQKLSFKFIDTSNLTIQDTNGNSTNFGYKLITDSIEGENIILIQNHAKGTNNSNYYKIEQIDKNVLRLVSLDPYDPIVIKPSEINKGIIYLIKRT